MLFLFSYCMKTKLTYNLVSVNFWPESLGKLWKIIFKNLVCFINLDYMCSRELWSFVVKHTYLLLKRELTVMTLLFKCIVMLKDSCCPTFCPESTIYFATGNKGTFFTLLWAVRDPVISHIKCCHKPM